jgi:hypothetical protein
MYTFGSAGIGSTYRNNLKALEKWRIIPRMLRNATDRNLEVGSSYLLIAGLDLVASLDYPLWRQAPLAGARRSCGGTRHPTQGWRARNCERRRKGRGPTHHVDRQHALHRSRGQG